MTNKSLAVTIFEAVSFLTFMDTRLGKYLLLLSKQAAPSRV